MIGAHDFPYLFSKQAASLLTWPLTWNVQSHDALGVFTLSTLWTWPYGVLYGLAGKLGVDFTVAIWLLGIIPVFVLGWWSMGRLLMGYGVSGPGQLAGKVLFVANTYILMLIDGGQLSLAVAYALLPAVMSNLNNRWWFVTSVAAVSFLDIRYLYLLFILIATHMAIDWRYMRSFLKTGLLTGLVLVGLHSYWLLPSILSKGPSLPNTYTRVAQVGSLSFAKLSHALVLMHPHWPENIFGQVANPSPYFVILPILAFFAVVIYRKNSAISFWSVVGLMSIFLVKGGNEPWGEAYAWLFTYIPGFSLFRDPTKFFPLLIMAYSVLVGFTTQYLAHKRKYWWVVIVYLVFLVVPILTQATGLFSTARDQADYRGLANFVDRDTSTGSILWIPSKPALGFSSPLHPSMDAMSLLDKRPFVTGVVGSYDLLNFLRDASYSGQLLDMAGIQYVGISSIDPARDSLKIEDVTYREAFKNQLTDLPWVKTVHDFGQVRLLQTQQHKPLFFAPQNTAFVVGSDEIYNSIELGSNGLVFAENQVGLLPRIEDFPTAKLILHRKTITDVAAALIPTHHIHYFPDGQLAFSPDASGWWKREAVDFVSWRDFLEQKYALENQDFSFGGGWSVSEGEHTLVVTPLGDCGPTCVLLARVMVSPRGREINFSTNSTTIGSVRTLIPEEIVTRNISDKQLPFNRADFLWHEVGQFSGTTSLSISTQGDINVVNVLALIPVSDWERYQAQATSLLARNPSANSSTPLVSYLELSPNHYRVTVTGLEQPGLLIFKQNYDSFWRLSGQVPVPVYSLLNGFTVSSDGEYDLVFLPQLYVMQGLVISLVTLLIVGYLFKRRTWM